MPNDSKPYNRKELRCLWAGFAGEPDEAERLAGFADCPVEQAAEMVKSFRTTAAARKAKAAEAARKQKPPREKKAPAPAEAEEVEISEPFPAVDLIAAAVNSNHGFSRVLASGLSRDRKRSVLVERVTRNGEYYFREKYTMYAYYKSKDEAIEQAKKRRLKLNLFDDPK